MKKILSLVLLSVVALLGSCSSDSSNNEEKELRTLLNNEWEVVSSSSLQYFEGKLNEDDLNYLFNDAKLWSEDEENDFIFGMNKKGGLYYYNYSKEGKIIFPFYYICTKQTGNKFTGIANSLSEPVEELDLHVRKVDDNTMKIVFFTVKSGEEHRLGYVHVLRKQRAWNESTNLKSILEKYDYPSHVIEVMGGENYERDVAQGRCQ